VAWLIAARAPIALFADIIVGSELIAGKLEEAALARLAIGGASHGCQVYALLSSLFLEQGYDLFLINAGVVGKGENLSCFYSKVGHNVESNLFVAVRIQ
jgi:hypothetical protein